MSECMGICQVLVTQRLAAAFTKSRPAVNEPNTVAPTIERSLPQISLIEELFEEGLPPLFVTVLWIVIPISIA